MKINESEYLNKVQFKTILKPKKINTQRRINILYAGLYKIKQNKAIKSRQCPHFL